MIVINVDIANLVKSLMTSSQMFGTWILGSGRIMNSWFVDKETNQFTADNVSTNFPIPLACSPWLSPIWYIINQQSMIIPRWFCLMIKHHYCGWLSPRNDGFCSGSFVGVAPWTTVHARWRVPENGTSTASTPALTRGSGSSGLGVANHPTSRANEVNQPSQLTNQQTISQAKASNK